MLVDAMPSSRCLMPMLTPTSTPPGSQHHCHRLLGCTMIPTPFYSGSQPEFSAMESIQAVGSSFWDAQHVSEHLRNLQDTVDLAKALQKELEGIHLIRQSSQNNAAANDFSSNHPLEKNFSPYSNDSVPKEIIQNLRNDVPMQISEMLKEKRISLNALESLSLEAAYSLVSTLRDQIVPFSAITSQTSSWEQKSMAVRLAQKLHKAKRNKRWKKKKVKKVAEILRKEREGYDKADHDADEWRAREIAKDIARRKIESMKVIAKLKANEERKRLESELELVLVVEKLQELRTIRIQKLKKQGHFLPEEDDKFLERVMAAVEEEERQAAAAAETDAAKDAIATAEVSWKPREPSDINFNKGEDSLNQDQLNEMKIEKSSGIDANLEADLEKREGEISSRGYDSLANLPLEFYHYYHGSSNDMGTLIEVRRMWDAYIRPGGSRIPGHWVQPPPPADEFWASYLANAK